LHSGFGSKPPPAANLSASISLNSATIRAANRSSTARPHYISRISTHDETL
jgi:hypothetical protein